MPKISALPTGSTPTGAETVAVVQSGVTIKTTLDQFKLSSFAATTSAQLAGVISDETGTGALVFAASPTLTGTPLAPTASAGTSTTQIATTAFVTTATREKLSSARTYYVRTDGSDSNNGLTNTAGGAFLTLQKAYDTVAGSLDLGNSNVTIQVADGTYTMSSGVPFVAVSAPWIGSGSVTISGNTTTPSNVVVSCTSANAFDISANLAAILYVKGFKASVATFGNVFAHIGVGTVLFDKMEFSTTAFYHVFSASNCSILQCAGSISPSFVAGSYTISGNAIAHWAAQSQGAVKCFAATLTLTGTPAFSGQFALAARQSFMEVYSNTYSGSATGVRYTAQENSVIFTNGAGATALPGNAGGSTATGGQYV
jgi:hypothetical protein